MKVLALCGLAGWARETRYRLELPHASRQAVKGGCFTCANISLLTAQTLKHCQLLCADLLGTKAGMERAQAWRMTAFGKDEVYRDQQQALTVLQVWNEQAVITENGDDYVVHHYGTDSQALVTHQIHVLSRTNNPEFDEVNKLHPGNTPPFFITSSQLVPIGNYSQPVVEDASWVSLLASYGDFSLIEFRLAKKSGDVSTTPAPGSTAASESTSAPKSASSPSSIAESSEEK